MLEDASELIDRSIDGVGVGVGVGVGEEYEYEYEYEKIAEIAGGSIVLTKQRAMSTATK